MAPGKTHLRTVLVTRPAHQAGGLMTALKLRGFTPIAAPVLEMHITDMAIPAGDFDALVFTSANGVTAFAARDTRRDMTVYAVGEATAAAARRAQFQRVVTGHAGAEALSEMMLGALGAGARVLYPSARDQAFDMKGALGDGAIMVEQVVVYAMEPLAALPDEAIAAIRQPAAVLLQSPRSASVFGSLAGDVAALTAICQSDAIMSAARRFGFKALFASAAPSEAALLDCLEAVKRDL